MNDDVRDIVTGSKNDIPEESENDASTAQATLSAQIESRYTDDLKNKQMDVACVRLDEDCQDAKHSLKNTGSLNAIYSWLIYIFFGGKIQFAVWMLGLLALFILSDEALLQLQWVNELGWLNELGAIVFVTKKLFYALGTLFMALLAFPTAKGLRRLTRSLIELLTSKIKRL